jgi:hypothetical protein
MWNYRTGSGEWIYPTPLTTSGHGPRRPTTAKAAYAAFVTIMENKLGSSTRGSMVKVIFELPEGSPYGAESLWAEKVAEGKYRLDNSPFYVYGYSHRDVVTAVEADEALVVQGPCLRSGHSTYRVFLALGLSIDSPEAAGYWRRLKDLGCSYEGASKRLFAVDVPPLANIVAVYRILEDGEKAGIWEFEEGHCGHSPQNHSEQDR